MRASVNLMMNTHQQRFELIGIMMYIPSHYVLRGLFCANAKVQLSGTLL